jgi:hypothetical protein
MILRLIIAFTRWVWGVSPAFGTADSGEWYIAMYFGAIIDIAVVVMLATAIICWMQSRRAK